MPTRKNERLLPQLNNAKGVTNITQKDFKKMQEKTGRDHEATTATTAQHQPNQANG